MSEAASVDLGVELCGVRFRSPLWLGSGGLGETSESLKPFQIDVCGAVVTRTLRTTVRTHRTTFPNPHLALDRRRRWMLNCEWGNLQPLQYWIDEGIASSTKRGPVIVSVSGRDLDDCVSTVWSIDSGSHSMYELNFSCSHAGALDGRINDDHRHVFDVVSAIRARTQKPIIAKLGWGANLRRVASSAEDAGCDAVAVTNTIGPGLDIDIETGRPKLGIEGGYGGVSGPAIFPIALQCVSEVAAAVQVPVVGIGGVTDSNDVIKMLMAGASCVQVYTAALIRGSRVFTALSDGLREHMISHSLRTPSQLVGSSRSHLERPSRLAGNVPLVNPDRCEPCGACVRVCAPSAITLRTIAEVDSAVCTSCGICVDACPPRYNALSLPE